MTAEARALWALTRVHRWPGRYLLVSLPQASIADAARLVEVSVRDGVTLYFAALVVESDEVSLTIDEPTWMAVAAHVDHTAVAGPYAAITLDLSIDLGVCGYLLPAAARLAAAGISIVPQCAYRKDHLLIREEDADRALVILNDIVVEASAP